MSAVFVPKILIVDDQEFSRCSNELTINALCEKIGKTPEIHLAKDISEMKEALRTTEFHLVFLDRDLGYDENEELIDGIDHISEILEVQPHARVLMLTAHKDSSLAVRAIQNGAMDFLTKGQEPHEAEYRNKQILKALRDAQFELETLRRKYQEDSTDSDYICKSDAMKQIEIHLQALSEVKTPVLILGDSGLGKTHTARRLRDLTKKHKGQQKRVFANININSLPDNLIESELFGHEKGAFTGAHEAKKGLFEIARDGDLFLDEIGDASLALQGSLLKVICEKEFRRVGGKTSLKTNARLIFATNKDLESMVERGTFRKDLYARICTITLKMPELKDRKEDIPYICQNITNALKAETEKNISYSDFPAALQKYFQRDYIPFNIRGIKSDLERLMIYSPVKSNGKLDYKNWRHTLSKETEFKKTNQKENIAIDGILDLLVERLGKDEWPGIFELKDQLEEKAILRAQEKFSSNKVRAKALGISEAAASLKLRKYLLKHNGVKQ